MESKPIKTKADYRAALKEIEGLMSARLNTPEGKRLDVLATLVEAYEAKKLITAKEWAAKTPAAETNLDELLKKAKVSR
jgi:antitoxin component HigA of HigAB toxin-antitoxin module